MNYYREDTVITMMTSLTEKARRNSSLLVLSGFSNLGNTEAVSNVAATHLKLEEMNATALSYGIKPKTWNYVIEVDTSKG